MPGRNAGACVLLERSSDCRALTGVDRVEVSSALRQEVGGATRLERRLHWQVRKNLGYVCRLLRRLGLSAADADDAAQQVFIVLSRRLGGLEPGKERAFLHGTAVRIAWRARRTLERRREELTDAVEAGSEAPAPDQLFARREVRLALSNLLVAMPLEVSAVFVLFAVEGMSLSEISRVLGIPRGTAASRLRRAREDLKRGLSDGSQVLNPSQALGCPSSSPSLRISSGPS